VTVTEVQVAAVMVAMTMDGSNTAVSVAAVRRLWEHHTATIDSWFGSVSGDLYQMQWDAVGCSGLRRLV
jgi:hypothetical protein